MVPHDSFKEKLLREGKSRGVRSKTGRKLSENNTRTVSRGQNELISEYKMAACDMITIEG